ncbi:MAG: tetratricopeptide repeat protein [Salinibacter sp.]
MTRPSAARLRASFLALGLMGALLAPARPAPAQQRDSTELRRFQRADSYLRAGQYEKAIGLLEGLYRQSPDNASFYRKLKDAYESVKRYDDAIRLVEDRLDEEPSPRLLAEKARLLHQKGDEQAAERTWTAAIERAPKRASPYRIVYQSLVDVRRFRRAIEVLRTARSRLEDPSLFRTELAYLYGLDGQHRKAMQEYVALLDASPNRLGLVRSRLRTFVDQGEGIAASTKVLKEAVEEHPLNATYRELLAWLYMSTDNYKAAYDVYRALDRLQQTKGERLYTFAQKAADADRFEVATTAFETILSRHPDAEVAPKARRALGDTYRRWAERNTAVSALGTAPSARYDSARAAYRSFLEAHPSHAAVPEVLADLGALQLDVYRNLDAAQSTLERVVSSHPSTTAANRARYDLGRLALARGDLERADLLFSRLAERVRSGDLADRARFELALLPFYRGRFEAAQSKAEATSADPSANVTNDAIELSVLIQENSGPDSLNTPLRHYATAKLRMRQHRYGAALTRLDSLLQTYGRHALADQARFQRARVHLARGDTAAARRSFREVPRRHPRSPYADRSLFRLARLLEAQDRPQRAITLYDRLLKKYPKSLLATDARSRLRTLRRAQS